MTRAEHTDTTASSELDWRSLSAADGFEILSNPIMIADKNMVIQYVNEAGYKMFENIEAAIKQDLPHFNARDVIGKTIDVFHKNPAMQRRMMTTLQSPHDGAFSVGGKFLNFRATPQHGPNGELKAIYVEWQDSTALKTAKAQVDMLMADIGHMAKSHAEGQISTQLDTTKYEPDTAVVAQSVNDMVFDHILTMQKIITCVGEYAKGNFDYMVERYHGERAFVSEAMDAVRDNFRAVVGEINDLSEAIVEGRLDREINVDKYTGTFRGVIQNLSRAYDQLNDAFSMVATQIKQMAITVDGITQSAQALATNSQISSTSVDEVSASTEETEIQVKSNSSDARAASQLVSGTSAVASEGRSQIQEMVAAMDGIRVSSLDIAKIIKVIDEIAFQTNLLALNAAVEAARAGQHGRGFAVVAQEVRNLAGRSAKAARETSDLIENAAERVKAGVAIADKTQVAFSKIADDVREVESIVGRIAVASEEQSRGVAQINASIGEVAKTTLSTSERADQLAASAAEMQAATESMQSAINRFRLRERSTSRMFDNSMLENLPAELMDRIRAMVATQQGAAPAAPARVSNGDQDHRGFAGF